MIGTIRKHQTWLWGIIILATIVSFVIFFTPSVRFGGGSRMPKTYGMMDGQPIPIQDYRQADIEAVLAFFLRFHAFPDATTARRYGFDEQQEARRRLVLLKQLEKLDIVVDDEAVADWIQRMFSDPKQPGSAKAVYARLLQQVKQFRVLGQYVTEENFNDFIRHQIGITHMMQVVGTEGALVTPRAAARLYRQENERLLADAVTVMASNFLARVQITPEALARFYTNRQSSYRTPERISVYYLRFPASNYVAQAEQALEKITNLTARIDALYQERGANAFLDTNGQVMPPDAAKLKIRNEVRDAEALKIARREAAKFGTELLEMEPVKAENLVNLASAKQMVVKSTPLFSETSFNVLPRATRHLAQIAFKLSADNPISTPLVGDGVVDIIAIKDRQPSRIPSLEEVKARVTADYRRAEARKLAETAGRKLAAELKTAVAQGADFTQAAIQKGYPPISLPKFSAASRNLPNWPPQIPLSQVKQVTRDMKPRDVSDFQSMRDGGFILYLRQREPVGEQELKDALPTALADLQRSERYSAFQDWLNHQVRLSRLQFPDDTARESGAGQPAQSP
jgi:hypothetical protein